jgi:hypothetical protein
MKLYLNIFLIALIIGSLTLVSTPNLCTAQTGTNVSGVISANATWTTADSPYNLFGPVDVNIGVTLTIESGVIVNLNNNYLQVDGTLRAIGDNAKQVQFINGKIIFTQYSNGWNSITNAGNLIENANLSSVIISSSSSIKLEDNTIGRIFIGNSSSISHNAINTIDIIGDSPKIFENDISTFFVSNGSPTISSNDIETLRLNNEMDYDSPQISSNKIGRIIVDGGSPIIVNNAVACIEVEDDYSSGFPLRSLQSLTTLSLVMLFFKRLEFTCHTMVVILLMT